MKHSLIIFVTCIYKCVYIVILITDMIVAFDDQSVEHYKRISWVSK